MFRHSRTRAVVLAGVVCTFIAWTAPGRSQPLDTETADVTEIYELSEADNEEAEAPQPTTSEDPTIPVDHLKLLVKPLTLAELEVEAAAWMELLKAKVREISNAEIAIKLENLKDIEESRKTAAVANVTTLQGQRTALIDRLNVILDDIEAKGGDPAGDRSYIQAVTAVELDISDAKGLAVRALTWLQSQEGGIRWGINMGKFLGIVAIATIASKAIRRIVKDKMRTFGASALLTEFVVMAIERGVLVIGFLIALTALEVSLGPVFAVLGAGSFVLAFALQSNLGNFASGLMIMTYKLFDVGDEVKICGVWGFIDSVTLANTKIISWQQQVFTIPNNTVWSSKIENYTVGDTRAWSLKLNVPYDLDIRQIKSLWTEIASANPLVLENPGPISFAWDYDGYSIELYCTFTTKNDDFWIAYEELFIGLQERLKEEGIHVGIADQFEIERSFDEFSHPLGLHKKNRTNAHQPHQYQTSASERQRAPEATGAIIEQAEEIDSLE